MPPFDMYIVKQDSAAGHGTFADKFISNGVITATAENKFYIPFHPSSLLALIKTDIPGTDTVSINIKLLLGNVVTDSGQWIGTASQAA